jgi:drug/metabolite transporter (DMT)-like permease
MDAPPISQASPSKIALAFCCVYAFWGATYTAARFGVHLVPATVLAGTRLFFAGCLMLLFCAMRGKRLWGSASDMRRVLLLGILLLFAGNVGLVWAEFYLPSGLSALLVAVVPLYVAAIEMALPKGERLRGRGQAGLALGLAGLGILAWPRARVGFNGHPYQVLAIVVLLLGAFAFASGSVLSRHSKLSLDPFVCTGWEMLFASFCDIILATLFHQWRLADWSRGSILAIAYMVVFGSLIGFSAYMWLLRNVPVAKVATYAYVNPMVAVMLGVLLLGEHLHLNECVGMVIILLAVFLVTSSRMKSDRPAAELDTAAIQSEA